MSFNQDLRKVMILYPEMEVQSKKDFQHLVNIHNILENVIGSTPSMELVKTAFDNRNMMKLENINDYYYLIFKSAKNNNAFKKVAFPNPTGIEIPEEFDLEKWAGLVYKIFDAVKSGDMDLTTAIDYYADTLDKNSEEDQKFKQWVKYYQNGENKKYSFIKQEMIKQGFQFPLMGPGFYSPDNAIVPDQPKLEKPVETKEDYVEWKNKLYSAIRRLDKLLRQGEDLVDSEISKDLADLLHQFDQEVRALRLKTTAADLSYRYAHQFKKLGFNPGYETFLKYAQEADADLGAEIPPTPQPQSIPQPEQSPEDNAIPENDTTPEQAPKKDIGEVMAGGGNEQEGETGAKEGEYEKLEGEVGLQDAVSKLEEIAGRLSDRRTIRLLAEFDIILDKIGIAPMFPELAEAQSKLIDGYSYALTRVTKMLGMLSSGKSLIEISDAKKKDLTEKTMKEVNKTLEGGTEGETEGNPALQEGAEQSVKAPPTPANQPAQPAVPPAV